MRTAPSLRKLQRQFMAALYDTAEPGPIECIAGNGLAPAARLRIYRRSCNETQTAALRATYPALLALVGEAFFDQTVRGYRRAHPSRSGNLQVFGDAMADYLQTLPGCRSLPYLSDVARLEWLRQKTVLAPAAAPISPGDFTDATRSSGGSLRIVLHPSLHFLDSPYPVLTIWRYALQPGDEKLTLGTNGESVALWREDGEVAMATLDPASFACMAALARGSSLGESRLAAASVDADFELSACLASLVEHALVTGLRPYSVCRTEPSACR